MEETREGGDQKERPNAAMSTIETHQKELAQERNPILAQLPHLSTEMLVLMIKRLESWKSLVCFLMSQAEIIKSSEKHCVSTIVKSAKASKQESGVVASLFPEASNIATLPTTVVGSIDRAISQLEVYIASIKTQILPNLKTMRNEASERIAHLTTMSKESTKEFQKEVKRASDLMEKLDALLTMSAHDQHDSSKDPWIVSLTLSKSFKRAQDKYNLSMDKVNATKTSLMTWEEDLSYRIESNITLLLSGAKGNLDKTRDEIASLIKINPQDEWKVFEELCKSKCTVLDNPKELFSVPRNELNTPLMEGPLRYLSSVLKKWRECYVYITPIGWLHQFNDKPDVMNVDQETPKRSIWLKSCTLSPLHIPGQHHDELAITRSEKASLGTSKSSTYRYTSVNHADLNPWWSAVSTLTKLNLRAEENASQSLNTDYPSSPIVNTPNYSARSSIINCDIDKDKSEFTIKEPRDNQSPFHENDISNSVLNDDSCPRDSPKTHTGTKSFLNIDTSNLDSPTKSLGISPSTPKRQSTKTPTSSTTRSPHETKSHKSPLDETDS